MTMYTKYVFHDIENDVADRDIKAILWDVVADQESKLNELRAKAFADSEDADKTKKLQDLYVRSDACLRELLEDAKKFTYSLQEIDECSRAYEQIENGDVAQIVATIQDGNDLQNVNEQPIQNEVAVQENEVQPVVENTAVVASENSDNEVQPVVESIDNVEPDNQPTINSVEEVANAQGIVLPHISIQSETNENDEATDLQIPIVSFSAAAETPAESNVVTAAEPVVAPVESNVVTATEPVETAPVAPIITQTIEIPNDETSGETISTENSTSVENMSTPLIIPTVESAQEGETNQLIIPTVEPQESVAPVENNSTELISTQPPATEVLEESNSVIPNVETETPETDLGSIPVITISSDGPLEAVSSAVPATEANESALPDIVPDSTSSSENLSLKKRTNDPVKAIMVSKEQANKLRLSLSTQEALKNAKDHSDNSGQVESNGSLETDVTAKQAQIEQMMNKANELYGAGQVAEAEAMFTKIRELNNA